MNLLSKQPAAAEPETDPGRRRAARAAWDARLRAKLDLNFCAKSAPEGVPESWFLGPRGENADVLRALIDEALDSHLEFRRAFHPEDPTHITAATRADPAFRAGIDRLRTQTRVLLDALRMSAPFASMRYQGHMLWDQAMPATIGLIAALLYNQNNVAAEASPITTRLEIEAGNDLCRMLGYEVPPTGHTHNASNRPVPWGHITSCGSLSNIEAMWAARNLKFSGVALRHAIRETPVLAAARDLTVQLWGGETARLIDLDTWTLLNLTVDTLAGLRAAVSEFGIDPVTLNEALTGYAMKNVGLISFYRNFMRDVPQAPVFLAPATGHYSWPKAATVLGLGQNGLRVQRVDLDARLNLEHVEATLTDLLHRRVPVIAAVAVIGTTEESAIDPLADLLALRDRFRARGLDFAIHADAAWGGYFRSMLRGGDGPETDGSVPIIAMSDYARRQYKALPDADSITVDPHKAGYVPYPAGALCYRNEAMRNSVSLQAPVVFHSQTEPTIGIYGLEGSKPGSSAAAVWLAHRVIRPDRSGYGRILGQCMWTSKRLFCRLATLDDPRLTVTLFNMTPAERAGGRAEEIAAERVAIRRFVDLDNRALRDLLEQDEAARDLFTALGSDQVILAFALNFKHASGHLNHDLDRANALNDAVFARCSMIEPRECLDGLDLLLTSSRFEPAVYGRNFVDTFCRRLGVAPRRDAGGVNFLISTTMDPWTTETNGGDFLATIVQALVRAGHASLDELGFG